MIFTSLHVHRSCHADRFAARPSYADPAGLKGETSADTCAKVMNNSKSIEILCINTEQVMVHRIAPKDSYPNYLCIFRVCWPLYSAWSDTALTKYTYVRLYNVYSIHIHICIYICSVT